jgi:hypothetical protein
MSDNLAPLLVKWLTHDLATPIATVMTASELLGDTADPEINGLVSDGARRLGARLRLIRAAFAPADAPVGGAAFRKLIGEGVEGTPLTWAIPDDGTGLHAALVAGAALLMADVRRGQPLTIAADSVRWPADATFSEAVAAALAGGPATDSRAAIAEMLLISAKRAGVTLAITADGLAWH